MVQIPSQQLPANPRPDGMNWKVLITGIVIGVVIVLIAVIGTVLYKNAAKEESVQKVSTPTQKTATPSAQTATESTQKSETADWKTYKTSDFSFKYPPTWRFQTEKETNNDVRLSSPDIVADTTTIIDVSKGSMIRFLPTSKYTSSKTLQSYVNEVTPEIAAGGGILNSITLSGEKAVRVDTKLGLYGTAREDFVATSIYTVRNGNLHQISRLYPESKQSEYEEIFKQILSTFEFLE